LIAIRRAPRRTRFFFGEMNGVTPMARQFSLPAQIPPISLLAPAADAAGRTSPYRSLANALKAYVIVEVNQGNAAPVTFSLLQAKDSLGTGAIAMGVVPIWSQVNTALSDANVVQTPAASFASGAALNDQIIIFEIEPEACLNVAGGYNHIAVSTNASNAANITRAELFILGSVQSATPPTSYV
jgi:hypothetical protein